MTQIVWNIVWVKWHSRNSTTKLTKEIAITSWVWPSKLAILWPVLMSHCIQVWSPLLVIIWLSFRNRQQLTNPSWPVSFWLKNELQKMSFFCKKTMWKLCPNFGLGSNNAFKHSLISHLNSIPKEVYKLGIYLKKEFISIGLQNGLAPLLGIRTFVKFQTLRECYESDSCHSRNSTTQLTKEIASTSSLI